jgi:mono/diheme cytochrome c family protein
MNGRGAINMRARIAVLGVATAFGACTTADTPEQQVERGAALYASACHHCHDVEGAIGVALSERVIASYGNAQRLFNYLQLAMPYQAPSSLEERAYWDLTAYLASARGARPLDVVLNAETAGEVTLVASLPPRH